MADLIKTIVLALALLVTVSLGALMYFMVDSPLCGLEPKIPISPTDTSQLVDSDDRTALVGFLGYLQYEADDKDAKDTFMPLKLHKVTTEMSKGATSTRGLTLKADCAQITLILNNSRGKVSVEAIRIDLERANKSAQTCFSKDAVISIDEGTYYSCKKGTYTCVASVDGKDVKIATLNIGNLEIETDRDPQTSKSGKFSKKEHMCSP